MRRTIILFLLLVGLSALPVFAAEDTFDTFLTKFDYETRADMKASSKQLIKMIEEKKAVLVDIRFPEEVKAWRMGFGLFIPLNELPKRYKELPKDKIIVTACPHKDRSSIAMAYLRTKGYNARYLTDGLTGLAEVLRGDVAKEFREDTGCCP
ncbi:Rhodanese-related sulfurtransferase [Trichlorobacter thiogenes]|uniref:Rhodanese-related sulfurtransferase n=1 Tax=Trichlorobacter thiogenes TaxID=115783 RepID=A0A1T4PNE2_9BACT|nr:rhodanese-like domain-containing protein [Trichlorobacter thiogenes]SJZ93084.1 Rhodanese-related sulfurtransferase [Trichlorobacter thiogenes]